MKFLRKGGFTLFGLPTLFGIEGAGFPSVILSGAEGLAVFVDLGGHCRDGFREPASFEFAFPDNENIPSLCLKLTLSLLVSFLIPCYFGRPEVCVGLGDGIVGTIFVTMPKAAVNKDYSVILRQDNVRLAGKTLVIGAIAESQTPEGMTQLKLRLGGS